MILWCECKKTLAADWQDEEYGEGNRVHNETKQNAPPAQRGWMCTCCGKVKSNAPKKGK